MTDEETSALAPAAPEQEAPKISFKEFLETVHPSVERTVEGLWKTPPVGPFVVKGPRPVEMITPDLRLHCERCDGERTFRLEGKPPLSLNAETANAMLINYLCGDCREQGKLLSSSRSRARRSSQISAVGLVADAAQRQRGGDGLIGGGGDGDADHGVALRCRFRPSSIDSTLADGSSLR
jgi:hypothetical protein